jgi:hypothetical protein
MGILLLLVFSKYFYLASLSSFYIFYLMERFQVAPQAAQLYLFAFLAAAAAGTLLGGPIGARVGRKTVIWVSILGVAPFTLALPFADLPWTCALSVVIGFVISSAFSAIVVFAQELAPQRVGLVSGLVFGLAFGFGGLGRSPGGPVRHRDGLPAVRVPAAARDRDRAVAHGRAEARRVVDTHGPSRNPGVSLPALTPTQEILDGRRAIRLAPCLQRHKEDKGAAASLSPKGTRSALS